MTEERLEIPGPFGRPNIVGILRRAHAANNSNFKPLALILHGQLAHKNQSYHKLLAQSLEQQRGWSSYRYDLRGQGGETEGEWYSAGYEDDVDDLKVIVKTLMDEGFTIKLLASHSRGSAVTSYYLSTEAHPNIPLFANISGRYDMTRILQNTRFSGGFKKHGYFDWSVKIAGKPVTKRVTPEGVQAFAEFDNSYLIRSFPQDIHVLTCHGTKDEVVPVSDASVFHKILSQRSPGTHKLSIIEGETHNWTRPWKEPVSSIMDWLEEVDPKSKL